MTIEKKRHADRALPCLVIMAKEPVLGRVKTRLARETGAVGATRFFRVNLALTLARLASGTRWETHLAVTPDGAVASRFFAHSTTRVAQGGGDLGARIEKLAKARSDVPVVIVGADIPGIRANDIRSAFAALAGSDCVLGPSGDGGYWLIGFAARAGRRVALDGIRWSTRHALADTRAALKDRSIAVVGAKDDVDDAADLARLAAKIGRLIV